MNLQTIKSIDGEIEYVLLPIATFNALHNDILAELKKSSTEQEYETFHLEDYVENPIALARIQARLTQADLAKLMGVTQAYVSKLERQAKVSPKMRQKVAATLALLRRSLA